MKKQKKQSALDVMKQTGGRFFGLYLKGGEAINAQFRRETEKTVLVYDRNNARHRQINKSKIDMVYSDNQPFFA
jgi:hypothetical protein